MGKTWKDKPRNVRNEIAKHLRTPKYRKRVVPNKLKDHAEAEVLEQVNSEWDHLEEYKDSWSA